MQRLILICALVSILGCNKYSEKDIILKNKCDKQIKYPEKLNVSYKGLKIATAELINKKGDYKMINVDKNVLVSEKTNIFLKPKDLLGFSYEFSVDTILIGKENLSNIETLNYTCEEKNIENKRVNEVLSSFKKMVDTIVVSSTHDSNNVSK